MVCTLYLHCTDSRQPATASFAHNQTISVEKGGEEGRGKVESSRRKIESSSSGKADRDTNSNDSVAIKIAAAQTGKISW